MFIAEGETRSTCDVVQRSFAQAGADVLATRAEFLSKVFHDQGIRFDHAGEERPFPLDIVPRIITADELDCGREGRHSADPGP
ncbi:MAG TPA: hypothetical protein VHI11_08510 [Jiangellaceae bacterium]|nr:hypothetical protein [Jiangellaceae bacterium]